MSYLVSHLSSGSAMNVDQMRSFDNEVDAWAYWDSLGGSRVKSWLRIYETSSDKPPRLLKEKDRNMPMVAGNHQPGKTISN